MHQDLFEYQRVGARWLASQRTAILADEQGVGKTPALIAGCDLLNARTVLVLTLGIARRNHIAEFERWQTVKRTVGAIFSADQIPNTDVLIVAYTSLTDIRVVRHLLSRSWDVLVADEADALKNPDSGRTRATYGNDCTAQFGLASRAQIKWLASGTLMPNHPGELWSHCRALFPDVSQGMKYEAWKQRYCNIIPKTERVKGANQRHIGELVTLLRPHVLRRLAKDVQPDLPPLRLSQVVVRPDKLPPMPEEVAEIEVVVKAAIAKASKGSTEADLRALQAIDEVHLASLRKWTGIAKAPAVADYLMSDLSAGVERMVVFAYHREVVEYLRERIPGAYAIYGATKDTERDRLIDGFQGKIKGFDPRVLILNIKTAGAAITLTAAQHEEFAEYTWVPRDVEQALKRCHRQGQTKHVFGRLFSLAGSSDEAAGAVLRAKLRTLQMFNDAMAA